MAKHHGAHTKSVKPKMHGSKGNLSLPHPSHAIHVAPQKDKMAGNVGGSAHMSQGGKPQPGKGMKFTGGKSGGK